MRVTFVLPGFAARPSGGYRVVYQYANGLVERGHEVCIVHPRSLFASGPVLSPLARARRELRELARMFKRGFRVWNLGVNWEKVDPRVRLLSTPTAAPCYVPEGDAVVATFWRTAEMVFSYPKSRGARFYLIQHHELWDGPENRVNGTWRLGLEKIVIAKWLRVLGESMGATDMAYIPNAIDHENFYLTRPIVERPLKVAMLYSPHKWKGAREGIASLEFAKSQVPDLEVAVFGIRPRPADLPQWMNYHENPPQEVLREEIYNGSAIYLCPSWAEGWGLPITEAMACGCAVVSASNGGVDEFVQHGESGLIVPARDSVALGDALLYLLNDRTMRLKLAAQGEKAVKAFTFERSLEQFERVLVRRSQGWSKST